MRIRDWRIALAWLLLSGFAVPQRQHVRIDNSSDWWPDTRLEEVQPTGPEHPELRTAKILLARSGE